MIDKFIYTCDDMHPCILNICKAYYKDPNHDRVLESAADVLIDLVKCKSNHQHLEEVEELFGTVFHRDEPVLAFKLNEADIDREVQEAVVHKIRWIVKIGKTESNRKNLIQDHEKALYYLAQVNVAANHVELAQLICKVKATDKKSGDETVSLQAFKDSAAVAQ